MRRRAGVGLGLVVIAAALVLWRCHREADDRAAPEASATSGKQRATAGPGARSRSLDPAAPASASLAGTITDAATRAPIAGAQVCADGRSTELADELLDEPFCVDSDPAGRYLIPDLPPAGYTVHASARSYRPAQYRADGDPSKRFVALAAAERRTGIDVALRAGGVEVTGTVADLTGGPIAHARVRSGGSRGSPSGRASAETDDRGRFSLWLGPGSIALTASADGYAPGATSGKAPGAFEILLTPEASFAGTVIDGATGQPIARARVRVSEADGWSGSGGDAFTGPDGTFVVGRLAPGRYTATARSEHGFGRTEGSLLVGLGQRVDGVVVKLSRAMRVEGKLVVAATQKPCSDGHVTLRDAAHHRTVELRDTPGGVHAGDGALPGTYTVEPRCPGFVARDSYPPVVIADRDVAGLVWEVDAGGTLRGKITTRSGEPIDDASVFSRPGSGGRMTDGRVAWSEPDGRYELRGMVPGTHQVHVSTQRAPAPADGFSIEIASGAVVERDLVLDDGGTIQGTVADPEGHPVGGMYILARPATGRWRPSLDDCRSGDTGAFACGAIAAGDYRVIAQASRFLRPPLRSGDDAAAQTVTVRPGQASTVKLVVEAQSGAIHGTVTDGDGKPVADAFVSAARESDTPGGPGSTVLETRWSWDARPNLTAVDGSFTVSRLAPGSYTLRAYRKGGGEAIAEHVAVGTTATLRITAPGTIEGTARHAGQPVSAITVAVHDPQTWLSRDEQFYATGGHYIVRDLPAGHFQVTVEADGARKQLELDLAAGEHKTADVELEDLVTITGRVIDKATSAPVAGLRMMANPATTRMRPPSLDDGSVSDARGRFMIRNVSRGKLTLMGMPTGGPSGERRFVHAERTVDGTGTVDIGDLEVQQFGKQVGATAAGSTPRRGPRGGRRTR